MGSFVHRLGFGSFAQFAGVVACLELSAGCAGQVAGSFQAYGGVDTQGKQFFFAAVSVLQTPVAATRCGQLHVQPQAIGIFAGG